MRKIMGDRQRQTKRERETENHEER